jgi:hypothetical protein
LRDLASAAAIGDFRAARQLTGGTAPGLRASGLATATLPDATASDIEIEIEPDEGGWLATIGPDTLHSVDGETWTFDWADRPLAVFEGTPEHDLFWLDPRHDLFLQVDSITITRTELRASVSWAYAAGPYDAAFFGGARLWLASLTLGSREAGAGSAFEARLDSHVGAATLVIPGAFRGVSSLSLVAAVTPASRFTNQSTFELATH